MKNHLYVLALILLMGSCTGTQKETKNSTVSSAIQKAKEATVNNPYQDSDSQKAVYKALKKKIPLTSEQLLAVLPEHINGKRPLNEYALQSSPQLASGMYGATNSPYNFFIQDGVGSSAIVRNFFDSLKFKNQGPEGTEYVFEEHDGYKTIGFLQPQIKRNYIRFIYNNRFQITLEGSDAADALWSYIDFENLKKLNQYTQVSHPVFMGSREATYSMKTKGNPWFYCIFRLPDIKYGTCYKTMILQRFKN